MVTERLKKIDMFLPKMVLHRQYLMNNFGYFSWNKIYLYPVLFIFRWSFVRCMTQKFHSFLLSFEEHSVPYIINFLLIFSKCVCACLTKKIELNCDQGITTTFEIEFNRFRWWRLKQKQYVENPTLNQSCRFLMQFCIDSCMLS